MLKKLIVTIKKNFEIFSLILLILITISSTAYFNYNKKISEKNYSNFVNNIYLKKTLNHIINNLEPKYKKINHKIRSGETFDKILNDYSINKNEILAIKNNLKKKVNLNKLNPRQSIQFTLDKTNNKIIEFTFQISNTEKIFLKRNITNNKFYQKILTIKLEKEIIYKENVILQKKIMHYILMV